jgi:hypothetical protein
MDPSEKLRLFNNIALFLKISSLSYMLSSLNQALNSSLECCIIYSELSTKELYGRRHFK